MEKSRSRGPLKLRAVYENTTWLFSGAAFRLCINTVVTFWVARYLNPSQYGLLSYIIATVALIEPFATMGLNAVVVRHLIEDRTHERFILGTAFVIRTIASCISFFTLLIIIFIYHPDGHLFTIGVFVLGVSKLLSGFEIIDLYFQSKVQSRFTVISTVSALLLASTLKILLVFLGASVLWFVVAQALEYVFELGISLYIFKQTVHSPLKWAATWSTAKVLLTKSWPLMLSGIAAILNLKIDQVMIANFLSTTSVGLYAAAAHLSEVWFFVPTAIVASCFPTILATRFTNYPKYEEQLRMLFSFLFYLALGVALFFQFSSNYAIIHLYGSQYASAASVLKIHIWGAIFIFMRALLSKWLVSEELYVFSLVTHGSGAILNILLNWVLIPQYGIVGAAWATVISYGMSSYFSLFFHPKTLPVALLMTKAVLFPQFRKDFVRLFSRSPPS